MEDYELIQKESTNVYRISKGYVPRMRIDVKFLATKSLFQHLEKESSNTSLGFNSAFQQLGNVGWSLEMSAK